MSVRIPALMAMLIVVLPSGAHASELTLWQAFGDAELLALASAQGWPGAGSPGDPILLADLVGTVWLEDVTLSVRIERLHVDLGAPSLAAGIVLFRTSDVQVVDVEVSGGGFGVYAKDAGRVTIEGGVLVGAAEQAITFYNVPDSLEGAHVVERTILRDARVGLTAWDHRASVVSVAGVHVSGGEVGISVVMRHPDGRLVVERNVAQGASMWPIDAEGMDAVVRSNRVTGGDVGIRVSGASHGARVEGNEVTLSTTGIDVGTTSDVLVASNTLLDDEIGIAVVQATDVTLVRNTLRASTVSVERSSGVLVYDNVFAEGASAVQFMSNVRWNVGPRAGTNVLGGPVVAGNAWEGWAFDLDGNGISDVPRPIATLAFDEAPLAWT
jgi:nitrous oxidase accessory protein NosD